MERDRGHLPPLTRRTIPLSLGLALALTLGVVNLALATISVPVLARLGSDDYSGTKSSTYFVWSHNRPGDTEHAKSFAKRRGEPRVRLNAPHTHSLGAAVDGSRVLLEQAHDSDDVDLKLYNLITGNRSDPGSGVNTKRDEIFPSISGRYLFFTRGGISETSPGHALILYNRATQTSRVLEKVPNNYHYLKSDQVNGDWAVWERCRYSDRAGFTDCYVFRYQISARQTVRLPNSGRQPISPAVTSDGTVYFALGGDAETWTCGDNVKLVRYPIGGTRAVIARLPDGKDALGTFAFERADSSVVLYFTRISCPKDEVDIFKVSNADTA